MFVRYQMKLTLGDQDWFSLLVWDNPALFLPLSCKWNYQNSVQVKQKMTVRGTMVAPKCVTPGVTARGHSITYRAPSKLTKIKNLY